eukprot:3969084-Pleurochrysis_carterae.AAC.1
MVRPLKAFAFLLPQTRTLLPFCRYTAYESQEVLLPQPMHAASCKDAAAGHFSAFVRGKAIPGESDSDGDRDSRCAHRLVLDRASTW